MKQIAALLLAGLLAIAALAACGRKEKPPVSSAASSEATELPTEEATEAETATEPTSEPEPEPATPEDAVNGLLRSAKEWDAAAIDAYLPEGSTIKSFVPAQFDAVVKSLLGRMEYTVGKTAADGDTAAVEVEITAADAEEAISGAMTGVVAKAAISRITGQPVDYTALAEEAIKSIDIDALPTKTTDATAYMIRDKDGAWKLDARDERNLPVLNAVTGGAVELAGKLTELAEKYGVTLQ